jgi:uncharacterized delta-60 repeat protein
MGKPPSSRAATESIMIKPLMISASVLACCSPCVFAQEGYPDLTFGPQGVNSTTYTGATEVYPVDTAVQADGKIVTLSLVVQNAQNPEGYAGVTRFNADGTLDTGFSFDGKVLTDFGGNNAYTAVQAIALQPNGKILVCGGSVYTGGDHSEFALLRLNTDGTLDDTFGTGGKVHIPFDEHTNTNVAVCAAIALQTDGRIVLAGHALSSLGLNYDFAATRLATDGSIDTSFGSNGKRYVAFDFANSMRDDQANSVAIDRAGNILLAGIADHGTASAHNFDMAVAKLTPEGNLDPNFNTDGKATVAFDRGGTNDDEASQALIQKDGRILLVGFAIGNAVDFNYDFAVARLYPDGTPDTTYGPNGNGRLRIPFDLYAGGPDLSLSGMLMSDGKLVMAGLVALAPNYAVFGFARLRTNGTLDPDFGSSGMMHFGSTAFSHTAIAVHPRSQGGRVVAAAGNYGSPDGSVNATGVVRLETDLIFKDGYE